MIQRYKVQHGSPEWHKLHDADVTASLGVPAILGCSPFETIAGFHARMMGAPLPGPDPESAAIRRGYALEPIVGQQVGLKRPEWDIEKANEYLRDPALKLGCTPDFWIQKDPRGLGVLETKTTGSGKFRSGAWGDPDEPTPPLWILLQVATQLMLADAAFGVVGVLVIGDYTFETHVIEVPRHRPTEHKIRVAVKQFWDAIAAGIVPELDFSRDGDLLRLMYPREVEGSIIDLTRDNRAAWLCAERARQGAIIKEAEEIKKAVEVELKSKIGNHEAALIGGWKCTLKTTHRKEIVQPAIDFRVLRTTRIKEEV